MVPKFLPIAKVMESQCHHLNSFSELLVLVALSPRLPELECFSYRKSFRTNARIEVGSSSTASRPRKKDSSSVPGRTVGLLIASH